MRRRVGVLALLLSLLPLGAVEAAQMDPDVPPTTSGPLIESNDTYMSEACVTRTFDYATSRRCRYFYRFDPSAETDAGQDYGVWWLQTVFTPKPGWCLVAAETTVTLDIPDFEATAWTEKQRRVHRRKKALTARLTAPAGGNATTPGTLEQPFVARKGKINFRWAAKTSTFKLKWKGADTRHKVAVAGGFEGPFDPAEGPPPITLGGGPSYREC